MCYSEFNDIIKTIEAMDADVISIETSRSGNELLKVFGKIGYKQEVGPGVYDIHSPRVPDSEEMVKQIELLLKVLPERQLWINPDCGLKTRGWAEVEESLKNMVEAVSIVRENREIEKANAIIEAENRAIEKEEAEAKAKLDAENRAKEDAKVEVKTESESKEVTEKA